ncbi:aminopeptidase P family N-terminal domain-containing protein, partial [bacterium]|nr:aminopeptidase P family N-terminal domain-containing protein [bacterium]
MYKKLLKDENIEYLLVPSTNRYLVEYSPLEENSRYILTKFSGSAGDALVTPDTIFLFVDGRYHIQADNQVDHNKVTVVKLQSGQNFYDELIKKIPKDQTLGVFSKKISQKDLEYLQNNGLKIKLIDNDPLSKDSSKYNSNITNTDGLSASQKIADIKGTLILTNLEEVSYLFNKRNLKKN